MIKIEFLYPEACNLFGDTFNIKYLERCLGEEAKVVRTALTEEPKFATEKVDMIYIGPMTERMQEVVIEKLKPYKEKIEELIDNNILFLSVGNSLEVFGKYIENENGSKIEGIGIFDIYAKRQMFNRHNSEFLGKYEDIEIMGFKSQFTLCYGNNENMYFVEVEKGIGLNPESKLEGIKKNNFIGTYILGPILVLNPPFTKKIIEKLGIKEPKLIFDESAEKAYKQRIEDMRK